MSYLILNVYKSQRMDITACMKDADAILEVFRKYEIKFDKKYTSLNPNGPSTITFKGIKAEKAHADITKAVFDLYGKTTSGEIGNVYVKFTSFMHKPKTDVNELIEKIEYKPTKLETSDVSEPDIPPEDDTL